MPSFASPSRAATDAAGSSEGYRMRKSAQTLLKASAHGIYVGDGSTQRTPGSQPQKLSSLLEDPLKEKSAIQVEAVRRPAGTMKRATESFIADPYLNKVGPQFLGEQDLVRARLEVPMGRKAIKSMSTPRGSLTWLEDAPQRRRKSKRN